MKVCPVCSSRCFDDMDICYGCMYRFDEDKKTEKINIKKVDNCYKHIPEYFEMENFTYIEDDECQKLGAHVKPLDNLEEKIVIKLEIPKSVLEKYSK